MSAVEARADVTHQSKERCSNIIGTAHALVIHSLFWLVTSDGLFRSSKGDDRCQLENVLKEILQHD
jgi:hypothetical protein